jgi:hypothetical protein
MVTAALQIQFGPHKLFQHSHSFANARAAVIFSLSQADVQILLFSVRLLNGGGNDGRAAVTTTDETFRFVRGWVT